MKKLYVVGSQWHYADWVRNAEVSGDYGFEPTFTLEEADVVMFTGGEDVNPAVYGHDVIPGTYFTPERDEEEIDAFNRMHEGQIAIGICRGLSL